MTDVWTKEVAAAAVAQGWNVFEIWEKRLEYEIQKAGDCSPFANDEAARRWVSVAANDCTRPDAIAAKAFKLVFMSKAQGIAKTRRKTK